VTASGRILVVEQPGASADALCRRVETLGHTLAGIVVDAPTAAQLAPRLSPDVVLLGAATARALSGTPELEQLRAQLDCPCICEDAHTSLPLAEQPLSLRLQLALKDGALARERARAESAEHTNRATERLVHEINNLLSAIRCNAFLIQNEPACGPIAEAAADIGVAVERSAGLVSELSNLLRQQRQSLPPEAARSPASPRLPALRPRPPGLFERDETRAQYIVLVVDDDPVVRRAVGRFIASAGYQVIESSTPEQGVAIAERYPVDLLITDLAMPTMTGYELARRIAKLRPGVRLIYMSGMSGFGPRELRIEHGEPADSPAPIFLQKPFAVDALMPSVMAMLTQDHSSTTSSFHPLANNEQ